MDCRSLVLPQPLQDPYRRTTWPTSWYRPPGGEAGTTLRLPWPLNPTGATPPTGAQRIGSPGPPCPGRPWSPARVSWSAPAASLRQAPFPCTPSSGPWRQTPGLGTSYPPWSRCPVRKFFQKIIPGIIPPGDGTRRQHFIYGRLAGSHCRRFKHFKGPLHFPIGCRLCGPWRGCGGPQRRRFIFPGERCWGGFHGAGCPRGRLDREKGHAIPSRFYPPSCFWCQPYLSGFRYTNDRDKFAWKGV